MQLLIHYNSNFDNNHMESPREVEPKALVWRITRPKRISVRSPRCSTRNIPLAIGTIIRGRMVARYFYTKVAEVIEKRPDKTGRAFRPAGSTAFCFGYGCRGWNDDLQAVWDHAIPVRKVVVVGRVADYRWERLEKGGILCGFRRGGRGQEHDLPGTTDVAA